MQGGTSRSYIFKSERLGLTAYELFTDCEELTHSASAVHFLSKIVYIKFSENNICSNENLISA